MEKTLATHTVRLVSLLRFIALAMHSALVLSAGILLATSGDTRSEKMVASWAGSVIMLVDLPAAIAAFPILYVIREIVQVPIPGVALEIMLLTLGGLQWYLLASLAARWTCGFQKSISVSMSRLTAAFVVGLLLVAGCAVVPWIPKFRRPVYALEDRQYPLPAVAFEGNSRNLKESAVLFTLDSPIPEGKNAIWCASFQMAWDRLKSDVVGEPMRVENAEAIADALNSSPVAAGDLPEGSYYAAAGYAKDGIVDAIRRQMRERFGKEPMDLNNDQTQILAYAYLQANVQFTLPFFDNEKAFSFTDSRKRKGQVSSFGLRYEDEKKYGELREQVEVLYLHRDRAGQRPTEFALDLCDDSAPSQIVLACIQRKGTLKATLDDLQQRIAEQPPKADERRLKMDSVLLVPNLRWNLFHRFSELEGAGKPLLNDRLKGLFIETALQMVDFRLDRSGVALVAESKLDLVKSAAMPDQDFIFDRPFLIVVKKRGALRPFFAMWVDNAELLSK